LPRKEITISVCYYGKFSTLAKLTERTQRNNLVLIWRNIRCSPSAIVLLLLVGEGSVVAVLRRLIGG
jgi:hypothetical protein